MGLMDALLNGTIKPRGVGSGVIPYGKNKDGGSHDHRTNTGDDRTPSQKEGDKKRKKG